MLNLIHSVGFRFRDAQVFMRGTSSDDERQIDADLGIVTYDDDGHYQVSSYRFGARSDHFTDMFRGRDGRLSVDAPLDRDREILLDKDAEGVIVTKREGDTITKLDSKARKAQDAEAKATAKAHAAELERLQREHEAEIEKIKAERRAELEDEKRRVEATV